MFKQCNNCQIIKPTNEFHRDKSKYDGRQTQCKACKSIKDRKHYQSKKGQETRQCYIESGKAKQAKIRYRQSAKGKTTERAYRRSEASKVSYREQRKKFPQRYRARGFVNTAVQRGKMPRASTQLCIGCGNPADAYHHYKGYDEVHKMDVVPLCTECHID